MEIRFSDVQRITLWYNLTTSHATIDNRQVPTSRNTIQARRIFCASTAPGAPRRRISQRPTATRFVSSPSPFSRRAQSSRPSHHHTTTTTTTDHIPPPPLPPPLPTPSPPAAICTPVTTRPGRARALRQSRRYPSPPFLPLHHSYRAILARHGPPQDRDQAYQGRPQQVRTTATAHRLPTTQRVSLVTLTFLLTRSCLPGPSPSSSAKVGCSRRRTSFPCSAPSTSLSSSSDTTRSCTSIRRGTSTRPSQDFNM